MSKVARCLVGSSLVLLALGSCKPAGTNVRLSYPDLPPIAAAAELSQTFVPPSQRYRIAVLTFIDQTAKGELVIDAVADMLTTELYGSGRFDLFDRSDLKQDTQSERSQASRRSDQRTAQNQEGRQIVVMQQDPSGGRKGGSSEEAAPASSKTNEQYEKLLSGQRVDGILLGYITSYVIEELPSGPEAKKSAKGRFTFDFRIVNASLPTKDKAETFYNQLLGLVVFSGSGEVKFETDATQRSVTINRGDIKSISKTISDGFLGKFTELSKMDQIKVTSVEGSQITISSGINDQIKQGFVGYVVAQTRLGTYDYLAQFTVVNTFPTASIAFVVSDQKYLSNVRKGSLVKIK